MVGNRDATYLHNQEKPRGPFHLNGFSVSGSVDGAHASTLEIASAVFCSSNELSYIAQTPSPVILVKCVPP